MYGGFSFLRPNSSPASFRRSTADNISPNTNMNPTTFHRLPNKSRPHSCIGEQTGKPSSYPNSRVIILSATTGRPFRSAGPPRYPTLHTPPHASLFLTRRGNPARLSFLVPRTHSASCDNPPCTRPSRNRPLPPPRPPHTTGSRDDKKTGPRIPTPEPRIRYPLRDENSTGFLHLVQTCHLSCGQRRIVDAEVIYGPLAESQPSGLPRIPLPGSGLVVNGRRTDEQRKLASIGDTYAEAMEPIEFSLVAKSQVFVAIPFT